MQGGVRYRFSHLLVMCIYAVLAGHSVAVEIAYYVELNFDYFRELLQIEKVQIRAAHWNIEMQHWILDMQLNEDHQTARKDDAVTNGLILRRLCMMLKKWDKELSEKPMKRFLMANEHDPERIERFLFQDVAHKKA